MENYEYLIRTLEKSVAINGDVALTTKHLLNILKLVEKNIHRDKQESFLNGLASEYEAEDYGDR